MEQKQVLIIGAGIAGISAAIWCQRLGMQAVVIEKSAEIGGQLSLIKNEITDFPPLIYHDGDHLRKDLLKHPWISKLDIRFSEEIHKIDVSKKIIRTSKSSYTVDFAIIATGVRPNRILNITNSPLLLSPWFSTTSGGAMLEKKNVLVIGGGDRAVESVYNLATYAKHVWLAVRSGQFRAREEWVQRISTLPNVSILMETEVIGTISEQENDPGVLLQSRGKAEPFSLTVDWILPRIGVHGNNESFSFLHHQHDGFLLVNESLQTNVEWLYAIGDIVNGSSFSSIALAVGQGMKATKHILLQQKERGTHV